MHNLSDIYSLSTIISGIYNSLLNKLSVNSVYWYTVFEMALQIGNMKKKGKFLMKTWYSKKNAY